MKQLGVLDTAFINLECPNTPQHIGGLGIYDPSTAPGGFVRFKQVIANFEQRLARLPLFRTRLVEVPGGLDRPYWVLDDKFDVEFHLRHIALPHPGDWRQLCIQVARLHARPLDMSRPLWEAYIIEGLDNIPDLPQGSFAVYTKIHHSLVDGAGGQSFMAALHDLEPQPDPASYQGQQQPVIVDREPATAELLTRALLNQARNTLAIGKGAVTTARDLVSYGLKVVREEVPSPDITAPKTRFNTPVGPHRVFEACTFLLDDFKKIKNAEGVTVNDVALAVVGGALRRYLENYDELPAESLAAAIPVNMRTRRDVTEDNNQVGSVFTALHTNEADPLARLAKIHHSALESKQMAEQSPLVDAMKLVGVFAPWLSRTAARMYADNQVSRLMPVNVSTVISNVAGPSFDLYCAGARMVRYHGMGLLTPGVGMFHLIFSSSGIVTLSVLADRDIVPDPEFYRECVEQSFAELLRAVESKPVAPAPAVKKAVAKKAAASRPARKRAIAKKPVRPNASRAVAAGRAKRAARPRPGPRKAAAPKRDTVH